MTLLGECVNAEHTNCVDCKKHLTIGVYKSAYAYYIGFFCDYCGPYSRESGYYNTREEAEKALKNKTYWR